MWLCCWYHIILYVVGLYVCDISVLVPLSVSESKWGVCVWFCCACVGVYMMLVCGIVVRMLVYMCNIGLNVLECIVLGSWIMCVLLWVCWYIYCISVNVLVCIGLHMVLVWVCWCVYVVLWGVVLGYMWYWYRCVGVCCKYFVLVCVCWYVVWGVYVQVHEYMVLEDQVWVWSMYRHVEVGEGRELSGSR